jgi:hypothetical protein
MSLMGEETWNQFTGVLASTPCVATVRLPPGDENAANPGG